MIEHVECAVIGAGAIGLAIARELARRGREVVVLEESGVIGSDTSSRNSEVIHSGIYYQPGTLKSKLCLKGADALYDFCSDHGVGFMRCGKLIVATEDEQRGELHRLHALALGNGVADLEWIDTDDLRRMEPALRGVAALFSPSSGIMDTHALMLAYQGDLEDAGGAVAFHSPVWGGRVEGGDKIISVHGDAPMDLACDLLVNCAGLGAQALASSWVFVPPETIPPRFLAKGSYFTTSARVPFTRLIYPVPEPGGLGVHLTLDLGGQARFGPDVEWIDEVNYDVNPARAGAYYVRIRRYWPDLPDGALVPGYAGIRPKVTGPGEPAGDFVIQGPAEHGVAGLVNLYGIESPGLTSSLALAETVAERIA